MAVRTSCTHEFLRLFYHNKKLAANSKSAVCYRDEYKYRYLISVFTAGGCRYFSLVPD